MKIRNLLLTIPLLLTTAVSLTSCSEDQKFAAKAATNIRIEDQMLKWDIPFGLEYPYSEVKINGSTQIVRDARQLDLSNFVNESGKIEVEIVTKPYYMTNIFKDTSVKASFDVTCLNVPTYEVTSSLLVGGEQEIIFGFSDYHDVLYEVCFYDELSYFESGETFIITKEITESCSVRMRTISVDKTVFNSPYIYIDFMVLDTPKVTLKDNVLSWEKVDFATEYYIFCEDKWRDKTTETTFELPFGIKEGDIISVVANTDYPNYFLSRSCSLTYKE